MAFQGFLKQATAVDVLIGPFVDEDDGKTAEPALTISQADVKLSKNGQALTQKGDDTTCAADGSDGYYNCELSATDTGTVGQLTIVIHESGALPVRLDYHVVEEAVYDAMYGGSAEGPLQASIAGRTLDVTPNGCAGIDWSNIDNATAEVDLTQTTVDAVSSIAQIAGFTTSGKAEIEAEVNDALVALNLDHLMKTAVGNNADMTTEVVDGTVLSNVMSATSDTSTYVVADDSLQGISESANTVVPDAAGTAASLHSTTDGLITTADGVVDGIQTDLSNATDGLGALKTLIDAASTHDAAAVWAVATRILTASTNFNDLNAAGIRAAVGLASANLDTQLADIPTVAELNARTLVAASYFDPAADTVANVTTTATVTNAVVTDAASRTASKATGFAVAGDAMALTAGERTTLADVILVRAVQNVEDTADKHSLGALIMFVTNWSISGTTLTAKKPSDDTSFDTYTLITTSGADPVTGVS